MQGGFTLLPVPVQALTSIYVVDQKIYSNSRQHSSPSDDVLTSLSCCNDSAANDDGLQEMIEEEEGNNRVGCLGCCCLLTSMRRGSVKDFLHKVSDLLNLLVAS